MNTTITAREHVLLAHESEEAWEQFSRDFVESLHPEGAAELALAEEMALTLWRNRRAPVYQAAMTARALREAERDHQLETRHHSPAARARQLELIRAETVLPAAPQLERLLKYEAQLDRKFDRLFRQFFKLQAIREKATAASNPIPTLTQQPISPEPETDKTNSLAPTTPVPPTSELAQTDKTNSPATAAPQSDKTNSRTLHAAQTDKTNSLAIDAAPIDKTNSPAPHPRTDPRLPASEAVPEIDKTNSPATEPAQIANPKSQVSNPRGPLGSPSNPIAGYVAVDGRLIPFGFIQK